MQSSQQKVRKQREYMVCVVSEKTALQRHLTYWSSAGGWKLKQVLDGAEAWTVIWERKVTVIEE